MEKPNTTSEVLGETLQVFRKTARPGEPLSATDVAEVLDCTRRTAYDRLDRLAEAGALETKKVGARARVWWLADGGQEGASDGVLEGLGMPLDVIDDADVGIFLLDADLNVVWINETLETYFGIDRASVIGRPKTEVLETHITDAIADPDTFSDRLYSAYEDTAESEEFECHVTAGEDRSERWLEHRSRPIETGPFAGGRVELYYDVTDRKRARDERQLRYSTSRSIATADTVECGLQSVLDDVCKWTDWDYGEAWVPVDDHDAPTDEEILLRLPVASYDDEAIGESEFVTGDYYAGHGEGLPGRVWSSGEPVWHPDISATEKDVFYRTETAADVGLKAALGVPVMDDGQVVAVLVFLMSERRAPDERLLRVVKGVATDLGSLIARKHTEESLQRQRALLEQVLDVSPVGIAVFNDDGEAVRANDSLTDILGLEDARSFSLGDIQVLDEDGTPVPVEDQPVAEVLETGEPVSEQIHQIPRDDSPRWVSTNVAPFADGEAVVVATADITEFKEHQRQLQRQRDELKAELDEVFERIDDAFYAVDDEFQFTYVNERAEELLQHSEEELLGESVWELFPDATETPAWDSFHTALETQEPTSYEVYFPPLDFWVEANVYPSETGLSVYFRDISDRKERERALEESERRYRMLVEHFPNGSVALFDDELRYTAVGGELIDDLGIAEDDPVGDKITERYPPELAAAVEPHFRAALEGDSRSFEAEYLERHLAAQTLPINVGDGEITAGMLVVRDVTEERERERELERFETIVETVNDGIYTVDESGHFTLVNSAYASMIGYSREELVGEHVSLVVDEDVAEDAQAMERKLRAGEVDAPTMEATLQTADGDSFPAEATYALLADGDRVGVVRDISERKDRERELEQRARQQAVIAELGQRALERDDLDELMHEASQLVADTLENDYCKVLDLDKDAKELLLRQGVGWDDGVVGSATVAADDNSQAGFTLQSKEPVVVTDLERESRFSGPELLTSHDVTSGLSTIIGSFEEPWGILGTHDTARREYSSEDVDFIQSVANILATAIERARRQRELERYEILTEESSAISTIMDEDGVITYGTESVERVLGYGQEGLVGDVAFDFVHPEDRERTMERFAEAIENPDARPTVEFRFKHADGSWIYIEATGRNLLDHPDIGGVVAYARDITDRKEREHQLEQQRHQLAALNNLNAVVRDINEALVDQSTREEIEEVVCERLASSDSYRFAIMAGVDPRSQMMSSRIEAGVDGYLEGIQLSTDPDDQTSQGPAGRAVQTKEAQFVHDVFEDPSFEPWREVAERYDYRSMASIPIQHEDTLYGVLGVYADRTDAFRGEEREVISQLGEIVGHAIAAVERKQALMSDSVIELEFRIRDVLDQLELDVDIPGPIAFRKAVPVGDGHYIQYGAMPAESVEPVERLVDRFDHWDRIRFLDDDRDVDEVGFELHMSEPPIVSLIAAQGGEVRDAVLEDGDFHLTVHLAPSVDIRNVIDRIEAAYPGVEMATRQQVSRADSSLQQVGRTIDDLLTERQKAALEAAYYAGFFEWPRTSSGEDVADSLEVSAATFHQHLRLAESKVLGRVLSSA